MQGVLFEWTIFDTIGVSAAQPWNGWFIIVVSVRPSVRVCVCVCVCVWCVCVWCVCVCVCGVCVVLLDQLHIPSSDDQ